jgi:hypothetical protein
MSFDPLFTAPPRDSLYIVYIQESVLFIGALYSNLYTAVDMPEPHDVHDVCGFKGRKRSGGAEGPVRAVVVPNGSLNGISHCAAASRLSGCSHVCRSLEC